MSPFNSLHLPPFGSHAELAILESLSGSSWRFRVILLLFSHGLLQGQLHRVDALSGPSSKFYGFLPRRPDHDHGVWQLGFSRHSNPPRGYPNHKDPKRGKLYLWRGGELGRTPGAIGTAAHASAVWTLGHPGTTGRWTDSGGWDVGTAGQSREQIQSDPTDKVATLSW